MLLHAAELREVEVRELMRYCDETLTQFGTIWRLGLPFTNQHMGLGFQVSMILQPFHSDRVTSIVQYVVVLILNLMLIALRYAHGRTVSKLTWYLTSRPRRLLQPRDVADHRGVPGRQRQIFSAPRRQPGTSRQNAACVPVLGGRLYRAYDGRIKLSSVQLVRRTIELQRHSGCRLDAQL